MEVSWLKPDMPQKMLLIWATEKPKLGTTGWLGPRELREKATAGSPTESTGLRKRAPIQPQKDGFRVGWLLVGTLKSNSRTPAC